MARPPLLAVSLTLLLLGAGCPAKPAPPAGQPQGDPAPAVQTQPPADPAAASPEGAPDTPAEPAYDPQADTDYSRALDEYTDLIEEHGKYSNADADAKFPQDGTRLVGYSTSILVLDVETDDGKKAIKQVEETDYVTINASEHRGELAQNLRLVIPVATLDPASIKVSEYPSWPPQGTLMDLKMEPMNKPTPAKAWVLSFGTDGGQETIEMEIIVEDKASTEPPLETTQVIAQGGVVFDDKSAADQAAAQLKTMVGAAKKLEGVAAPATASPAAPAAPSGSPAG
ncbi:MAG TPA: hypothetical protein VEI97_07755 [bacterium]|nr:hypothetical protein [bacterium]